MEWALLIVCIAIIIVALSAVNKQSNNNSNDKTTNKKLETTCKYIDGTLQLFRNNFPVRVAVCDDKMNVSYNCMKLDLNIPYNKLISYKLKTDKDISEHVTLGRVLVFGVFALGMKKQKEKLTNYMVLEFLDNEDKEQTIVLQENEGILSSSASLILKNVHECKMQYNNKSNININKEVKVDA